MKKNITTFFAQSASLLVGKGVGIVLLALVITIPQEILGYDLARMKIVRNEKRSVFTLKGPDNKYVGQVTVSPESDFPKLKISAKPDALVIDTREISEYPGKPIVRIYFNRIDQSLIVRRLPDGKNPDEINRLTVELQSDVPSRANLLFEGQTETDGKRKHFWKMKPVLLTGKPQVLTFDQMFPANLKYVHIRIDVIKPCLLEIRKINFGKVQGGKKKIDPSINHILNGGAERGWTGIIHNPLRNYQSSVTGKYINWSGKEISDEARISLDPETKYEGDFSFRIEQNAKEAQGAIKFNPVPFAVGEPASFSFYAKAEKPVSGFVHLYLASGYAMSSAPFRVGISWKKYEVYISAWGAKQKGITIFRDVVNSPAQETGLVTPIIVFHAPGKIWIDNVAYSVGGHAVYKEKDTFFITHKWSKDNSYYFPNEKISANVSFRNASKIDFEGKASYEILDVFGKTILTKEIGNIAVPAGKTITETVAVEVPTQLRGPITAVFKAASGEKVYSDAAYAGIVERGGELNKRIGMQLYTKQNFRMAAEYLRDFRIGSIRIFIDSSNSSIENAELMKQFGFDFMCGTGIMYPKEKDPVIREAKRKKQIDAIVKYGKYIDILETENEANISGGTLEDDRKNIRELYDLLKKHDLKCKLAGPTTCHTDFAWTASILASPEGKLLDIVTEHPYRTMPELPDYADDAAAFRKLIDDLHRPGIPYYATEAGRVQPCMPENGGFVGEYSRTAAAHDIRNIIQGFSGGLDRYYHFQLSVHPQGSDWEVLYAGTRTNNGIPLPGTTMYALRTLSDRLEQAKCVKRIRLGMDYRCPVFDHGTKRTVVIWKWNGNPGTFTFKPEDAKQFTAYNFVGTKIPADKLEMNEFPIYLDTALSAADAEKAIRRATLISEGSSSFEFGPMILGEKRFAVEVRNRTGNDLKDIKVSVDTPNAVSGTAEQTIASIGPEANARAEFDLKNAISTKDCKLKVSVREQSSKVKKSEDLNLRAILVKKVEKPLVIDGDLSDWQENAVTVKLDKRNAVKRSNSLWSEKEDKIRAELRYAWDDNFLYTAVTVFKPEFYPVENEKDVTRSWKFDSLQIAYDTLRNAKPGIPGFGDDDFEYSLVQCCGKPIVYRQTASSAVHDSLVKPVGVIKDEVKLAVKKYADRVVYEMAFAKRSVSPFNLVPYSVMRTGLIVNVNNGKDRAGWLELTPGVGQLPKRPDQWMDLVLLP